MFNSTNVPHWIPSTVYSTTKFYAWRLTRRIQLKIVHKNVSKRNVWEFICVNERMMQKGVRMAFTLAGGWAFSRFEQVIKIERASDDFSARSNIRVIHDFLIMKYRLGHHQIINISVLMRYRYLRVYDFCRNKRVNHRPLRRTKRRL